MKSTFTLSVPQPCLEKWEQFSPTTLGGYCSSCKKEVIDFTSWDEDRIQSFFRRGNDHTCGRLYTAQLKKYSVAEMSSRTFPLASVSLLSFTLLFSSQAKAQKAKSTIEFHESKDGVFRDAEKSMHVQGVVKFSDDQTPIPGVNIMVKGTLQGTVSNENGKFSLLIENPRPTDTLIFSFIGMESAAHSVYESNELAVVMKSDFTMIGETVMLGALDVKRFGFRNLLWRIENLISKKTLTPERKQENTSNQLKNCIQRKANNSERKH